MLREHAAKRKKTRRAAERIGFGAPREDAEAGVWAVGRGGEEQEEDAAGPEPGQEAHGARGGDLG
eukprot:3933153-Rhodomonas_salina.2